MNQVLIKADDIDFSAWAFRDERSRVITPAELHDDVADLFDAPQGVAGGLRLPWNCCSGCFGVRPGELTLWHGANGHGKSLLVGQAMLALMEQGARPIIISLEIEPKVSLYRMARQALGPSLPATRGMVSSFIDRASGRVWLYSRVGMVDLDMVLSVMNYAVNELGADQIVIDSLMKLGLGVEDYSAQKNAVARLCNFAMASRSHVHLVVHSRKPQDGSEDRLPNKYDIKGAGDISDQADNVLNIWRNRKKELIMSGEIDGDKLEWQKKPDAKIICDKQRHFTWEGTVKLWFDRRSLQFCEDMYATPTALMTRSPGDDDE